MPVEQLSAAMTPGAAGAPAKKTELGQDTFLKLMLTQLKNQDPLKPTDPAEFLGQLAQFSQVTGIQSMQESVAGLASSLRSSQLLDGTALVGRDVLAAGDSAAIGETGGIAGGIDMPEYATQASLVVTDAGGQVVRRLPLPVRAGFGGFQWDGTLDGGARAPAGTYRVSAYAQVGGATQQLQTQLASRVDSVTIDPRTSNLTLNTGLGPVALADVRRVM